MPAAFLAVFDYPGPVVAAINGHAIAGGCVVAMAADVRLMSGGSIGLTEVAVGVPFPVGRAGDLPLRDGHLRVRRHAGSADRRRTDRIAARVDRRGGRRPMTCCPRRSRPPVRSAQHSPFAYAATKEQLHRPARAAIDAAAEIDPSVREGWLSDETCARIAAFLDALK